MIMRYLSVILIAILTSHARAECNFVTSDYIDEMTKPSNISFIDVKIHKSSKFARNVFKIVTSKSDSGNIPPNLRKKFKAVVTVKYKFGNCSYQAMVRQSGDMKDHVKFVDDGPIQSLDVKLKDGNVFNATRFKLLIPETRYGKNEILATLILRDLGFIAPETFEVNVSINNVKALMLFQEKAEKELLEKNFRREGPIFEGDESLLWSYKDYGRFELEPLALARLTNDNWFKKGYTSKQIVIKSYEDLQTSLLDYASKNLKDLNLHTVFPNSLKNKTFINYHSVLIAMNGIHALRPPNRKYYYNAIEGYFEPIYYDGNVMFIPPKKDWLFKPITQDIIDSLLPIRPTEKFISLVLNVVTSEKLKKNFIDRIILDEENELFFSGSVNQFKKNLSNIVSNISKQDLSRDVIIKNKIRDNSWYTNYQKEKGVDQTIITRIKVDRLGLSLHVEDGSILKVLEKDLAKILSRNEIDGKRFVFIPENQNIRANNEVKFIHLGNKIIKLSKGIDLDIDEKNKRLQFMQTDPKDWVLLLGGDYSNWELVFKGAEQSKELVKLEEQRFNEFGLTGCLTLYKTVINDAKFFISSGRCEDSINFIDSDGEGVSLTVKDSFADAVDADFSRLSFSNLEVVNAGNDCFDVSNGHYFVRESILNQCQDKAISVGEMSSFRGKDVFVRNANIGVSSKDSSRVLIESFHAIEVTQCAEAKRKKQEFGGATLKLINLNCESSYEVDSESKILKSNS